MTETRLCLRVGGVGGGEDEVGGWEEEAMCSARN